MHVCKKERSQLQSALLLDLLRLVSSKLIRLFVDFQPRENVCGMNVADTRNAKQQLCVPIFLNCNLTGVKTDGGEPNENGILGPFWPVWRPLPKIGEVDGLFCPDPMI